MNDPRSGVPPIFAGLFDDAALFPPGNATMPDAVRSHAQYRRSWYGGSVGWFVCPAGRIGELAAENDAAGADPIAVSLTVPGGPADLDAALASAQSMAGVRVAAVELPVADSQRPTARNELAVLAESGVAVFAEVAPTELTPSVAAELATAGLGLKLRTGGTTASAFPDRIVLGAAIGTAMAAGLTLKCTAGLHNAVAHRDPVTGLDHHGFLNVLLAVHAALTGTDPAEQLALEDPVAVAAAVADLTTAHTLAVRTRLHSIGSCSITEPLTDLDKLGLVNAP